MPGKLPIRTTRLAPGVSVHTFGNALVSHLLVGKDRAVLIDCHDPSLPRAIREAGLPRPEAILHTHIQPQHCREGRNFGDAEIFVHAPDAALAFAPEQVREAVADQKANLATWMADLGSEPYGIAGCQMEYPPDEGLPAGRLFRAGETIPFGEITIEVIPLPFHGKNAVGFVVRTSGSGPLAIFCGDFLRDGPFLVDAYSLAFNYADTRLPDFPGLAEELLKHGHVPLFPSTGSPIFDGKRQLDILQQRIGTLLAIPVDPPGANPEARQEIRRIGRFREIERGIFNMTTVGNAIVLLADDGHALMVDPGPCDYENPERTRDFLADIQALEEQAGLRHVDMVLITHFHGDHIDMVQEIREKYPDCQVATWTEVADVMENPGRFPYACRLPWYDIGRDRVSADLKVGLGDTLAWKERLIRVIHLPGHALRHCGFLISLNNHRIALTGDTVQGNGETDSGQLVISNHAAPVPGEGSLSAYQELARHPVDLNIGGHGSFFRNCPGVYHRSIARIQSVYSALAGLFPPGTLREAFVPPWMESSAVSIRGEKTDEKSQPGGA